MFRPERVIFERDALSYPLGERLYRSFREQKVEVGFTGSHNRVTGIPGKTRGTKFFHAKRTLVVGIRRSRDFETCRPSAHYQLPLATGCPGLCEYCYLLTNLGRNPYIRVYVNVEEILATARDYIRAGLPETTVFEGAATSDPLAVEPYTGSLALAIEFFAREPQGRFRFVTKFTEVDSLLNLDHQKATRFRFSINTERVIKTFEHATPPLQERLAAARKVTAAGYPLGFMIAPIIATEDWEEEYGALCRELAPFADLPDLTFELITHRFTARAKNLIRELFPKTKLPLGEKEREFKWGQFGYGKYVYPRELYRKIEAFFRTALETGFPHARIEYFV
ncbi:MAG: spore photoproduct lyase [Bacillota bacterium]|nr:spore photoproduct lyase [Bacillota bacterium]